MRNIGLETKLQALIQDSRPDPFVFSGSLRRILEDAGFVNIRFDAFAPAADHVAGFLDRMIPRGVRVDSAPPLAALMAEADVVPLRYKLMFAASRPAGNGLTD